MIAPPPSQFRADETRTRHLHIDQHRIERGIEPKPADKPHQLEIGITRIIFAREREQLIESCPRRSLIQRYTRGHCSMRRVEFQSSRDVATGSIACRPHQATSSPKLW